MRAWERWRKGRFEVIGGDEIERALIQERTRTRLMRPVAPSVDGPRAKAEVAGRGLRCPLGEPPLIALPITVNRPGFDAASFLAKDADHGEEVSHRAAGARDPDGG
jgi:hypothetical protein